VLIGTLFLFLNGGINVVVLDVIEGLDMLLPVAVAWAIAPPAE
jgi:hypothetical protein